MPHQSPARYQTFGLTLQSALPLPELRDASTGAAPADIIISRGEAACPTVDVVQVEARVRVGPDAFWLDMPGIARFLVQSGQRIVIEAYPAATEGDIRAYLLGSAIGAALHQRGWLPLHASAVEIDGQAIAFVAPSGGGKSTMAMHLDHLGYPALCDDICAIDFRGERPRIWPGLCNLKLWRASLASIDSTPEGLEPVVANVDKYRAPIQRLADYRAYDLTAVVLLEWGEIVEQAALPGAAGMAALMANTYRGQFVAPMRREAEHWRQCLELLRTVPVRRLTRPRSLGDLDVATAKIIGGMACSLKAG